MLSIFIPASCDCDTGSVRIRKCAVHQLCYVWMISARIFIQIGEEKSGDYTGYFFTCIAMFTKHFHVCFNVKRRIEIDSVTSPDWEDFRSTFSVSVISSADLVWLWDG